MPGHSTKGALAALRGRSAAAVPLLLILVACGGGPAATAGPVGSTPTQPQGTAASVPTSVPTSAPMDPTQGPSSVSDVCSLLSAAEVSAAYGETLDTAVPSEDPLYAYCTYGGDGEVRTYVTKGADTATTMFNTMKVNAGEGVAGIGDEAWWSTDGFAPGLYIMKSGVLAYISGPQTGPEDAFVELGELLASRL